MRAEEVTPKEDERIYFSEEEESENSFSVSAKDSNNPNPKKQIKLASINETY